MLAEEKERISDNFWNGLKYTSAILYYVFIRSIFNDDYKIQVTVYVLYPARSNIQLRYS